MRVDRIDLVRPTSRWTCGTGPGPAVARRGDGPSDEVRPQTRRGPEERVAFGHSDRRAGRSRSRSAAPAAAQARVPGDEHRAGRDPIGGWSELDASPARSPNVSARRRHHRPTASSGSRWRSLATPSSNGSITPVRARASTSDLYVARPRWPLVPPRRSTARRGTDRRCVEHGLEGSREPLVVRYELRRAPNCRGTRHTANLIDEVLDVPVVRDALTLRTSDHGRVGSVTRPARRGRGVAVAGTYRRSGRSGDRARSRSGSRRPSLARCTTRGDHAAREHPPEWRHDRPLWRFWPLAVSFIVATLPLGTHQSITGRSARNEAAVAGHEARLMEARPESATPRRAGHRPS